MIRIINYDAGNILNVEHAFKQLGVSSIITNNFQDLDINNDILVLPGVGSFGATVTSLDNLFLKDKIIEYIKNGGRFLGICLGLQLLFEGSEESPTEEGLGVFKGKIKKFPTEISGKVPQIGWNSITVKHSFFKDFDNGYFYFVHSYYAPYQKEILLSSTEYGVAFSSAVICNNIVAVQFHPEKSGSLGLNFLKKVLEYFETIK